MSKPTVLAPWYVVTRQRDDFPPYEAPYPVWYVAQEGDTEPWSSDRTKAMLFTSLHSAHRVARASGAYVVVLVDEKDYNEYRS